LPGGTVPYVYWYCSQNQQLESLNISNYCRSL
jgi:hypothetical protein